MLAGLLVALVAFEYLYSWLILRQPRVRIAVHESSGDMRTSIVLPGFSNPARYFGRGMRRILSRYGPMLVVHYGTAINFDEIYRAIMTALKQLGGPKELLIYGHSMGGQLGEMFRERYEREGSPYGAIRELFLDCSPGTLLSLPSPEWFKRILRSVFKFYWGGPIMALVAALGHTISRITMPAPLSNGVDRTLYKKYARGLMWFNNRGSVAQLRFMLNYRPPTEPVQTDVRIIYIGAEDPQRDAIVRQGVSVPEWLCAYPTMELVLDKAVGHAWPMEQPEAYDDIVQSILSRAMA
jgi:pimeloyl-ACP methyl ester carboxylesterase